MSATLSVVIPVYNEEAGLASLYARLYPELDKLERQYEVLFVDDGSQAAIGFGLNRQCHFGGIRFFALGDNPREDNFAWAV